MRFLEKEYAREYDERLSREGYPGILLQTVESNLPFIGTLIDVGAGSGFFTIPLAERGFRITAIEPSPAMMSLLEQKIRPDFGNNIKRFPESWESWQGEKADFLLCAHSLYPMKDWENAIVKMKKYAGRILLFVRSDEGSHILADAIRNIIGMPKNQTGSSSRVKKILIGNNIPYILKRAEQERIVRFTDIENEAEYHLNHFGAGEILKSKISDCLKRECIYSGTEYSYSSLYVDDIYIF